VNKKSDMNSGKRKNNKKERVTPKEFSEKKLNFTKITEGKKERTEEEELKQARNALLNILEDTEEARKIAVEERNKTLTIIQNFADGILVFDEKNNLELINPLAEEFLGVKKEEIIQKNISELSETPKFKHLIKLLDSFPEGKAIKSIFREELPLRENLFLEITTLPLIMESNLKGTLAILHNVTREKNIEKMKTEFVSISAHQLRTPLSAVKWTIRMILDGDVGEISNEQRDLLQKTYLSNERMINLINDLLNVTRIEEGKLLYEPKLAQLEDIVWSVAGNFKQEIKRKKIDFKFKKPSQALPKVKVDQEKIKLAVENLIDNAIRYTFPKGKVEISFRCPDKVIEFKVKDSGVGIPKDKQERIFTKFFRGPNVIRMETEGTGLGLYTTKNIIEAHKGKIWFESEEGKGTTFYFALPTEE